MEVGYGGPEVVWGVGDLAECEEGLGEGGGGVGFDRDGEEDAEGRAAALGSGSISQLGD